MEEKKKKEKKQQDTSCKNLSESECIVRPDCKFSVSKGKGKGKGTFSKGKCSKIRNSKTTHKVSKPADSHVEEKEQPIPIIPPQVIHIEEVPIIIDPCDEKESTKKEVAEINKRILELTKKCNETKYKKMEHFNDKKLMDLIVYIYEKKIEKCQDLFNEFPESSERTKGHLSKPYIFEALWKIIFLLRLDNLTDGDRYDRQYKKSIEGDGEENNISCYDYLNGETSISKINSGSESGIADFYFTVTERPPSSSPSSRSDNPQPKKIQPLEPNACEEAVFIPKPNDVYVFTSKYYRKEKGISNYDIEKIALEVLNKYQDKNFKIVSLVRNGADYKNRLERSSKELVKSYVSSNLIFDESDLISIYYPKLYKFLTHWFDNVDDKKKEGKEKKYIISDKDDWREILKNPKEIINILDNLRFHQKYIVEYTNDLIKEGGKEGRFIWGAVARSGKSYMVGGLVAKRKPKIVLLILGAVNETKSQFIDDLFRKYTELQDYNVVDFQDSKKHTKGFKLEEKKNYVFVISQEALRIKIRQERDNTSGERAHDEAVATDESYSDTTMATIKQLLLEEDKIIFFDEIHQGSGTDSMQEDTIGFFYNTVFSPHKIILIMVTATYAKPLAKYGKKIDGKDCTLIEWDYEMIMKMKNFQIENVTLPNPLDGDSDTSENAYLINKTDPQFVNKMKKLKVITDELNKQNKSCQDIAYEYKNYPELVYLLPTLKEKYVGDQELMSKDYIISEEADGHKIDIRNKLKEIFKLKAKKFTYNNSVKKLLRYIYNDVYEKLLFKKYDYIATGEGNFHSQLWFLPTSMKNDPKPRKRPAAAGAGDAGDAAAGAAGAGAEPEEDSTIVGPMLKELGLAIINHELFFNFNVCVVHSAKETQNEPITSTSDAEAEVEVEEKNRRKLYFQCIDAGNVKKCIKDIENKSKQADKSLIILTAQRLRLGISLPCADIAIHMDSLKAYDIIYQSMFRVLTERAGKTHGFFVDMVLDRAIQFMYKYTQKSKNSETIKDIEKDDVVKSLLLFDVGSIKQSVGFTSITNTAVNSYRDIAENFKIDSDDSFNAWKDKLSKDQEFNEGDAEKKVKIDREVKPPKEMDPDAETVKKTKKVIDLLHKIDKDEDVKRKFDAILKSLQFTKSQKNPTNAKDKKGKFVAQVLTPPQAAAGGGDGDGDGDGDGAAANDDAPEDREQLFKNVVEHIKNIFSLSILFDDGDRTLQDILELKISDNIAKIKKCEDPDIMYYCYLIATRNNSPEMGDKVKDKTNRIGEIVEIESIEKTTMEGTKPTYTHTYTIKFQDKDEPEKYPEAVFKKDIKNLSIPTNFELEKMDDDFITGFLQKNIALIQFLLENQSIDQTEINNLYDNIKKEMKKTKLIEQLEKEKDAFKDKPLDECPENFIKNKKVLDIVRKYLTPKDSEKKLFGEVFTPLELICEMLSKLPTNVWTNKHLKWLDPANGIGNFPIVVYYKLMEGLKHEFKDDDKRSKWILEKMIYMSELNPVNVALSKKVFKMIDSASTPNILRADFITGYDAVLKKMRDDADDKNRLFDIIIGNPPYNSTLSTGDNKPYLLFTFISISLLETNGLLTFITPPSIYDYLFKRKTLKLTGEIYKYDKILDILYVNADNNYLKRFFKNVGSDFSYFVLKNKEYSGETQLLYEKGDKLLIEKIEVPPPPPPPASGEENSTITGLNIIKELYNNILHPEYVSIKDKIFSNDTETFEFKKALFGTSTRRIRKEQIEDKTVKDTPDETHKYKIIESYKMDSVFNPKLHYFDKTDTDYDKKRLIVSAGPSNLYPHIIPKNSFTLSDNIYYTVCEDTQCENLLFFLESPLWKYIDKKYRPSNSINSHLISSLISHIKPLPSKKFDDDAEMYEFFKLTKDEISKIDEMSKLKGPVGVSKSATAKIKPKSRALKPSGTKDKTQKTAAQQSNPRKITTKGGRKKTIKKRTIKKKNRYHFW
jgi:hypothetical protein